MSAIEVTATAEALSENAPYSVVDLSFHYADTTTQGGTAIYYSATLSDGDLSEDVLFPLAVTAGSAIPADEEFAYTPSAAFTKTVTASNGKIYYTPAS
ncbi:MULTISPECIES: hypothetical protein [Caproicibacterium]|uniref:Uncharacterized protein n=1 Tax=Caproicibacterium argilliputei TaxID=3030016 RepID=A0AA97DAP7_9FIRM|nr:hypothetical protein [Caproicibacterium argilliputei]WOC33364.1 hypothetical protein PXC00_05715 [Caproicibacterium argilliputei]